MLLKSTRTFYLSCWLIAVVSVLSSCTSVEKTDQRSSPTRTTHSTHADLFSRIRAGFVLPDLSTQHVANYERWNTVHPTFLTALFKRAEPFLFHIVEEIDKRGMPMEIALLPAVESAFKPTALSSSNASGLWQFIPSTGRGYGLRQDRWYDGRRDLLASTKAALDYLQLLHKIFDGDWFLAIAAYNAGQGTVLNAIKKNQRKRRKTDYLNLDLRSETKRYVPKLIAFRNIVQNPQRFNVKLPKIANQPYFKTVHSTRRVNLQAFSQTHRLDYELLRFMNTGYLRATTPSAGPHHLLVPIETNLVEANAENIRHHTHIIEPKETLSSISRQYQVSIASIQASNGLTGSTIRIGDTLQIPLPSDAVIPKPNTSPVTHYVQRGDTLWSISRTYQVQLQELLDWNQLSVDQVLSLNQALTIFTTITR